MRKITVIGSIIGIVAIALGLVATTVNANPFYFIRKQTSTATTTPSYMTPGTATTTLTLDTYTYDTYTTNTTALAIQYTGSTSAAVVDFTVEYSMDGIDWYGQNVDASSVSLNQSRFELSSTTPTYRWGAGSTVASTTLKVVEVSVPTRYVRAQFSVPSGISSTNGAVWAEWIAKKEKN